MPELAEVEITKRKLLPLIKNKTIVGFWTDWPRGLKLQKPSSVRRDIRGRKILDGHRQGKVIFLHLSGEPKRVLAFHQRMSGRLAYSNVLPDSRTPRVHYGAGKNTRMAKRGKERQKWVHFVFRFSGGSELRFVDPRKFGIVWYGSPEDFQKDNYIKTLGIDLQRLTFEEFLEKIKAGGQLLKAWLLRQDVIAGIGNIIADEALWGARINPKRKTSSLSKKEIRVLFGALKKTIAEILRAGGTSMRNWGHPDGKAGRYQEFYKVYDRAGHKCFRCGRTLKRIVTAGRGTTFCPRCQRYRKRG